MLYARRAVACAFAYLTVLGCVQTASASNARVDIPIGQVVLPNGDTRYFVPVSVGAGAPVDAELDTGSFGLRVLKAALKPDQYRATGYYRRYTFGSGARFNGALAEATLSVGSARTDRPMLFQVIDSVDCIERVPNCPVSRVKPEDYRIAGDGYPNKGFNAILGLSLRKAPVAAGADNPLTVTGDAAWIVVLPRPGSPSPGHLIVNPDAKEREGFAMMRLEAQGGGWADTMLAGCLVDEQSKDRFCGKTLLDSGAPGVVVNSEKATEPSVWPPGRAATLEIGEPPKSIAVSFSTSDQWSNRVHIRPPRDGEAVRVSAGTLPFFHYAILYDAKAGAMGFKRREDKVP